MPSTTNTDTAAAELAAKRRAEYEAVKAEAEAFDAEAEGVVTKAQVLSSWRRGSTKYSALDYLAATVEHSERLPLIRQGLQHRLRDAKARLVPETPELALGAVAPLSQTFGLPATATNQMPRELAYESGSDGALVVVQDRMHELADVRSGALSGRLTVILARGARHVPLSATKVLDALERNGWTFTRNSAENVSTAPCNGGKIDSYTFDVRSGYPEVPTIAAPSGFGLADNAAHRIAQALNGQRIGGMGLTGKGADGHAARVVSSETGEDGEVHTVLDADVSITGKHAPAFAALVDLLKSALPVLIGVPTHAGRIVSAELGSKVGPVTTSAGQYLGAGATVRVVAVSRAS